MAARLPPEIRARAAELRAERGWSGAYALRRASAEAKGYTPAQARGVHPDEPQYRRILGASQQTRVSDFARSAAAVTREVDPSTGKVTYTFTDRKSGEDRTVTVDLQASKAAETRIMDALGPDVKISGTK